LSAAFIGFSNVVKIAFNLVQIAAKAATLVIVPAIEIITRALAAITFGDVSTRFRQTANDLRLYSRELKTGIKSDFKDIGDAVEGLGEAFESDSVNGGTGLADAVKQDANSIKTQLNSLINQRISLEKQLAEQTQNLAKETSEIQIKEGKKVVKELQANIQKSIQLQQKLVNEIAGRQTNIARIQESSGDKLRRLNRDGLSESAQQADIELQAIQELNKAKQAAAEDPEEAARLAKKAEQTAQEINDKQTLIGIIEQSRDIQIEAEQNAIAVAEENQAKEAESQATLEAQLQEQKVSLDELIAQKLEIEKPATLDIQDNIDQVSSKIDSLQAKLSALGGTITINASASANEDIPAAHGGLGFVPKESTYLLDKGERVLSPNQNRDLVSFLQSEQTSRVANVAASSSAVSSQPGAQNNININLPNGQSFGPFADTNNSATALQAALELEVLKRGRRR
jgi:hypothetical protein